MAGETADRETTDDYMLIAEPLLAIPRQPKGEPYVTFVAETSVPIPKSKPC
jgi:hypothetical protein